MQFFHFTFFVFLFFTGFLDEGAILLMIEEASTKARKARLEASWSRWIFGGPLAIIDNAIKWATVHYVSALLLSHDRGAHPSLLQSTAYGGLWWLTNPCNYLKSFKALMMLQNAYNALICKSFPVTFRDATRAWFNRLPLDSISFFEKFGRKFITQF